MILLSSYGFFMPQLHNFLRVSQNVYQLHNLSQIRVSIFRPGYAVVTLRMPFLEKNQIKRNLDDGQKLLPK